MVKPAAIVALAAGDIDNFMVASTPGGIEKQEAQGQAEFVRGEAFPIDMSPERKVYESLGFIFGEPVDELFIQAKLPEGWGKRPTDHSMHSDILDEQGRTRVEIFYKAAFYDRRASAHLKHRYVSGWTFPSDEVLGKDLKKDEIMVTVVDSGKQILFSSGPIPSGNYELSREWETKADAWLTENYPDAKNPAAYWEE